MARLPLRDRHLLIVDRDARYLEWLRNHLGVLIPDGAITAIDDREFEKRLDTITRHDFHLVLIVAQFGFSPEDPHSEGLEWLRLLRDRFADVLKIRAPDHDRYAFHISIAYLIDWLTDQEQADHAAARRRWRSELERKIPVLELGAPEYCTFDDMFAFRRRLLIT